MDLQRFHILIVQILGSDGSLEAWSCLETSVGLESGNLGLDLVLLRSRSRSKQSAETPRPQKF